MFQDNLYRWHLPSNVMLHADDQALESSVNMLNSHPIIYQVSLVVIY